MATQIWVRVLEVADAKPAGTHLVGQQNLTHSVGMRVSGGKEVKTGHFARNLVLKGADFRTVVAGMQPDANLLMREAHGDSVSLHAYERLKTDLVETGLVGRAKLKVADLTAEPKLCELELKRKGHVNGTLKVEAWLVSRTVELQSVPKTPFAVGLVALWLGARFAVGPWTALPLMLLGVAWFLLELPTLLGTALSKILPAAVPGLNMSVKAVRLYLSLCDATQLLFRVEVDDFKLAHDTSYKFYQPNFVAAGGVNLAVSLDLKEIASNLVAAFKRWRATAVEEQETDVRFKAWASKLDADDQWLSGASSDPFFALFKGDDEHNLDALPKICESEVVDSDLNPTWSELVFPRVEGPFLVAVYDWDMASAADLIGVGKLETMQQAGSCTLYKQGVAAGLFHYTATPEKKAKPPAIAWARSPVAHHNLKKSIKFFTPTRILTLRVREFRVDDPVIAFDIAETNDEFNVNNFVRLLSQGKVKSATGVDVMPNTVRVQVKSVKLPLKATQCCVVCELRGQKTEDKVEAKDGQATGFQKSEFEVADPSAVLHLSVYAQNNKFVGELIVKLESIAKTPLPFHVDLSKQLEKKAFPVDAYIDVTLTWFDKPGGKSHNELLEQRKLKALEQLQENSAEMQLGLNVELLVPWIKDMPVLFAVDTFELNRVKFHLKALFQGYDTDTSDDAIFIDQIDLRDKLAVKPGESGVDAFTLAVEFVKAAIGPILSEVSILDAAKQILSGVVTGLFSSEKDNETLLQED